MRVCICVWARHGCCPFLLRPQTRDFSVVILNGFLQGAAYLTHYGVATLQPLAHYCFTRCAVDSKKPLQFVILFWWLTNLFENSHSFDVHGFEMFPYELSCFPKLCVFGIQFILVGTNQDHGSARCLESSVIEPVADSLQSLRAPVDTTGAMNRTLLRVFNNISYWH